MKLGRLKRMRVPGAPRIGVLTEITESQKEAGH